MHEGSNDTYGEADSAFKSRWRDHYRSLTPTAVWHKSKTRSLCVPGRIIPLLRHGPLGREIVARGESRVWELAQKVRS